MGDFPSKDSTANYGQCKGDVGFIVYGRSSLASIRHQSPEAWGIFISVAMPVAESVGISTRQRIDDTPLVAKEALVLSRH